MVDEAANGTMVIKRNEFNRWDSENGSKSDGGEREENRSKEKRKTDFNQHNTYNITLSNSRHSKCTERYITVKWFKNNLGFLLLFRKKRKIVFSFSSFLNLHKHNMLSNVTV